jgi:hypothetical protein
LQTSRHVTEIRSSVSQRAKNNERQEKSLSTFARQKKHAHKIPCTSYTTKHCASNENTLANKGDDGFLFRSYGMILLILQSCASAYFLRGLEIDEGVYRRNLVL